MLRGAGFFAALCYVWFRTVTALPFRALRTDASAVPAFTLDPATSPRPRLTVPVAPPLPTDPDSLSVRRRCSASTICCLVGSSVRWISCTLAGSTPHLVDVNLTGPVGVSAGEVAPCMALSTRSGEATPSRRAMRYAEFSRCGTAA